MLFFLKKAYEIYLVPQRHVAGKGRSNLIAFQPTAGILLILHQVSVI